MKISKNTKLLIKCFKEGFFSTHKRDIILLSIFSILFISIWALFGIFSVLNKLSWLAYGLHLLSAIVGTFGISILLYFLKNIENLENEFKEKIILRRKLKRILSNLEKEVNTNDLFKYQVTKMADNITGLGMWIKNYVNGEYVYTFADKTMREELYNGLSLKDIIGKSDANLMLKQACKMRLPISFSEEDIPKIKCDCTICDIGDITDEITAKLKKPCRFFETIKGNIYDVWKTPLMNEQNEVVGIVGAMANISAVTQDNVTVADLVREVEAYQIGDTPHYYIKRYAFTTRCSWCPFNRRKVAR